ncbi:uncharacterized protein MYCFIDRAFT_182372 [Pseudocercospora fijiensis CIRAD86]|uniref:Uncharacterized protein n=1 Tax=Pseudocercospora fijiensis (strain CIRAD86) TaxID=383855 RepID=M2Z3Y2_PSEFD|nr:uncharacterized protein MYCFIDRAFT_182372 [Pseudocercospora fijiensis CIRAD86]EME84525.1 hypothetical protein MYCFIDRAFT_182372 [Pseudocercospora fijiensis CIRAD86]
MEPLQVVFIAMSRLSPTDFADAFLSRQSSRAAHDNDIRIFTPPLRPTSTWTHPAAPDHSSAWSDFGKESEP